MNKVLKGLVAVAATAAMAVAGFAGASTAMAAEGTHTVTISPAKSGHTYEAYQIFTGNLGADGSLGNVVWGTGVDQSKLTDESTDTLIKGKDAAAVSQDLAAKSSNSTEAKAYATAFSGVLSTTHTDSSDFVSTGAGSYTISGLSDGYYLIQDKAETLNGKNDAYTSFILQIIGKDVTVAPKSTQPTVDKKIQDEFDDAEAGATEGWGNTADHDINESFQFKLDANIPAEANLADYKTYEVKFNDTMSKGVTFESIASVKVNGNDGTAAKSWTLSTSDYTKSDITTDGTTGEQSWSLTINDVIAECDGIKIAQGFTVEVIYNAHLNEKATINSATGTTDNMNSVNLEYSNNPNAAGLGKTEDKTVYAFTFGITNKKVIDSVDGEALPDAGFKLYTDEDCTKEYKLVKDDTLNAYRPAKDGETAVEMKSAVDGTFPIKGLDAGTYYLKETTTPKGYTTAAVKTITIKATHSISDGQPNVVLSSDSTLDNKIVDKKGSTLPSTGGMGTVILYVAGIAVFVLAGATLVMALRRRNA